MKHKAEDYKGQAKEFVGEHTDNESLANEGRADQVKGKAKQVGDDIKDAYEHAKDSVD
jgi:uncharacterized protein YjbJ (UPF0337 family)